jgi:hypothetical protein
MTLPVSLSSKRSISAPSVSSATIRGFFGPIASPFCRGIALILAASVALEGQVSAPTQASTATTSVTRAVTATIVTHKPVIDGKLDDPVWQSVEPLTGFVQRELHEGQPVSERTEIRIITDAEAIYVGAWLYDRDPSGIVPGEKIRDVPIENSDYVAIILDTYLDRQNGFVFATTPAGVEYDGQVAKEGEGGGVQQSGQTRAQAGSMGGFNLNWDGTWIVRTSADSLGWYAEFRIPYSTLRYAGGPKQTWGLNVSRGIRRRGEDAYWAFIPRQFNLYRLSRAGTVVLPNAPAQRLGVFTPYVLGGAQNDFTIPRYHNSRESGFDAKLGVTRSLTLDATYNTDFAQVEVDEQQTNLTRFPLFFPEKRPFFLENAGVFSAGTPQSVDLFFSRRIGIDSLGHAVPIRGGGRLSGRAGGLTVGALEIVTDGVAGIQPSNSYSVGRVSRELPNHSRLGVIAVDRVSLDSSADRNGTYGVDGRLGVGDALTFDGWAARTSTPNASGDENGFSARAAYSTSSWNAAARTVSVGDAFNPEVGFLTRTGGFRYYEASVLHFVRNPKLRWLKDWNPHTSIRNYYRPDGYFQSGWWHVDVTELEFADGGKFGPEFNLYHEGLQQPFAITPTDTIPVGSYNFPQLGLDWSTNPGAPFSLILRGDYGAFYDGSRAGNTLTLTWRRGASISTSLVLDDNVVHLDEGNFEARRIGARVAYFFTPRVFVQTLTQYSNQVHAWSSNTRFAWLSTAGTGLFVVVNDGEQADGFFSWQRPQSRSLIVKYTRQFGSGS